MEGGTSPLVNLVRNVNNFYLSGLGSGTFLPLLVGDCQVGLVSPSVTTHLSHYPNVFNVTDKSVTLSDSLVTVEDRNEGVDRVLCDLREKNIFLALNGWRNERYEIRPKFNEKPLMMIERSATPLFGVRQYGVHINGQVNHSKKGLCLWLQRRSPTKQTWPNMWDNFVGGGLSEGHSVLETAIKEAEEEANVPKPLAKAGLKPAGTVSFFHQTKRGLHPNTEFVFDLDLPEEFTPSNNDGEVSDWRLVPVTDIISVITSQEFRSLKPQAAQWLLIG